jgi:hypothetical protein
LLGTPRGRSRKTKAIERAYAKWVTKIVDKTTGGLKSEQELPDFKAVRALAHEVRTNGKNERMVTQPPLSASQTDLAALEGLGVQRVFP